jgi:Protein of unknown function (DUF2809)
VPVAKTTTLARDAKAALSQRFPAAIAVMVTVIVGLTWRKVTGGEIAKFGGDALYATMIYAVLRLIRPHAGPALAALAACLICWAVEFAQLTPFPAAASSRSGLARLVLGSTFNWSDCAAYPVGVLLGVLIHLALIHLAARAQRLRPAVSATRN